MYNYQYVDLKNYVLMDVNLCLGLHSILSLPKGRKLIQRNCIILKAP